LGIDKEKMKYNHPI